MQQSDRQQKHKAASRPRRLNGIIILAIVVAGLVLFSYKPTIDRIHCNDEILANKPEVIMLATWWCPYCYQARRYLTRNDISYCEYDIERSSKGAQLFNDVNGQVIPVLIFDKYILRGFDESRVESLLAKARDAS